MISPENDLEDLNEDENHSNELNKLIKVKTILFLSGYLYIFFILRFNLKEWQRAEEKILSVKESKKFMTFDEFDDDYSVKKQEKKNSDVNIDQLTFAFKYLCKPFKLQFSKTIYHN